MQITLHADRHITCRPSHYIQTVTIHADRHITCRPSHYMQTITLHADRHITCRPSHYMQTVTLHADRHITCRLVLGPQVVSPQSTVHSIQYGIFRNAVGDMLIKLANGQTYLQFTQVLFLCLSLPLLLLLAILSLFQFKVRQATPLHPHHTLHLFKPLLKVSLVGSEDWKPLDTYTSYNSPRKAHCLGVRFYFYGCICMKGETPTHQETHRASSLPYSTST